MTADSPADGGASRSVPITVVIYAIALVATIALAVTGTRTGTGITVGAGIPLAFVLFLLVLMGVAFFHHHTMWVALAGVLAITAYTGVLCPDFRWPADQIEHSGGGLL